MTQVDILKNARDPRSSGYKVDVNRGERIGRVSSEWFSRPADERYLSLSELFAAVRGRAERSRTRIERLSKQYPRFAFYVTQVSSDLPHYRGLASVMSSLSWAGCALW